MGEAVQVLSGFFVELEDITRLLNEYESTKNNKAYQQAAIKIKTGAPRFKEVLADPAYKNKDTAPLLKQLKVGYQEAFARAKALKGGGKSEGKGDEEDASPPTSRKQENGASPNGKHRERGERSERERGERSERDRGERSERDRGERSERDRGEEREKRRERRERESTEQNGADEEDGGSSRREQEASNKEKEREKERERRKREEERERERQRRDAQKKAEEEEERRKNVAQDRAKEEERRREEKARKEFEEEEAKDKEFRRQAYLKKKEEEAKRAEQAKRIMENNAEDGMETGSTDLRMKFRGKDIWSSILKDQEVKSQAEYGEGKFSDSDYTLIFVGSKNAGKSTLIHRFLEKSGEPKSSTALEYTYGKHAVSTGVAKDATEIVHTWELAGGTSLLPLFDVCLTVERIKSAVVVLVLDLSEPSTMMDTLIRWQDTIRARADDCMKTIEKSNPPLFDGLKRASMQHYPETHADKETVKPIAVPLIIVGTKYDLFQDFEAERRKICVRTLRYFANTNGASLIFVTAKDSKDDGTFTKFRALLNYYLFKTQHNRTPVIEYTKPVLVPAGTDNFEAIGRAPYGPTKTGLAAWKSSFDQIFPPVEEKAQDMGRFEEDFAKFSEPAIDALRFDRERELERLRRLRNREPNGSDSHEDEHTITSPQTRKKKNT
eukprot:Phypoly_transcript_04841.p1 GENE.Phypoly_transcript_04841~~Phypoly_transcript_04841.p1  ORF type:complete len:668 (+),score=149.10 Phypoly_transcript_04841:23-2026(+)